MRMRAEPDCRCGSKLAGTKPADSVAAAVALPACSKPQPSQTCRAPNPRSSTQITVRIIGVTAGARRKLLGTVTLATQVTFDGEEAQEAATQLTQTIAKVCAGREPWDASAMPEHSRWPGLTAHRSAVPSSSLPGPTGACVPVCLPGLTAVHAFSRPHATGPYGVRVLIARQRTWLSRGFRRHHRVCGRAQARDPSVEHHAEYVHRCAELQHPRYLQL